MEVLNSLNLEEVFVFTERVNTGEGETFISVHLTLRIRKAFRTYQLIKPGQLGVSSPISISRRYDLRVVPTYMGKSGWEQAGSSFKVQGTKPVAIRFQIRRIRGWLEKGEYGNVEEVLRGAGVLLKQGIKKQRK